MKQRKLNIYLYALIFFIFSSNVYAQKIGNITILSESNMSYPLVEISRLYSKKYSKTISVNFNYSFELIQLIEAGDPADIFISSHPNWIETLKQKGLVDVYNVTNIARDKLLLITSKNNNKLDKKEFANVENIDQILKELDRQKIPLIVDSEYTSLGKYTNSIFKRANIDNQRIFRKLAEDKKSIIRFVEENKEYCAIVLASSIENNEKVKILKDIQDSQIYYQGLVIAGNNMQEARNFLEFLKSDEVKQILINNGLLTN